MIFIVFFAEIGFSQNENYKKNEIAINIFSLSKSPDMTENIFKNSFYGIFLSNLSYKRFLNSKNVIRITYYRPFLRDYKSEDNNKLNEQGYKEKIYLKIGYEYKIMKNKKINPYIASDILYQNSEFNKITGNLSDRGRIIESSNKNIFGIALVFGANFKVYNNIYLGLESDIAVNYTMEKKESFSYCENAYCSNLIYSKNYHYMDYMINPVLLNIKVMF